MRTRRATSLRFGHAKLKLAGGLVAVGLAAGLAWGPGAGAHTSTTPHCDQTTTTNCHVGGGASQNLTPAPFSVTLPGQKIDTTSIPLATVRVDQNLDGDTADPNEQIVVSVPSQTLERSGGTLELLVFKTGGTEPQATITSVSHDPVSGSCLPDPAGIGRRLVVTRTASDAEGTLTIRDTDGNVIAPTPISVPPTEVDPLLAQTSRTVDVAVC